VLSLQKGGQERDRKKHGGIGDAILRLKKGAGPHFPKTRPLHRKRKHVRRDVTWKGKYSRDRRGPVAQ